MRMMREIVMGLSPLSPLRSIRARRCRSYRFAVQCRRIDDRCRHAHGPEQFAQPFDLGRRCGPLQFNRGEILVVRWSDHPSLADPARRNCR